MGIHDGHREGLRERFLEHGLDHFQDHNVLEFLLSFCIPRVDTNPVAHRLLDKFGTLSAVFDAPIEDLLAVQGVGKNTAVFLKAIPQISRRYEISKFGSHKILDSTKKAGAFLIPRFYAEQDEVVYLVCLDAKCKVLNCQQLARGSVNSTNVNVRRIVERALVYNASHVILAHNHPSGIALPSPEDKVTTRRIQEALAPVGITLMDHIIVADGDFVSLADSGFFK